MADRSPRIPVTIRLAPDCLLRLDVLREVAGRRSRSDAVAFLVDEVCRAARRASRQNGARKRRASRRERK